MSVKQLPAYQNPPLVPRPLFEVAADELLSLFFPTHCAGCGRLGEWLCQPCRTAAALTTPLSYCQLCGRSVTTPGSLCSFHRDSTGLDGLVSYADYHAPGIAAAISAAKYQGVWAALRPLARYAWLARWHVLSLSAWQAVVPLALDARRERDRGYNQSAILARELGRQLGAPVRTGLRRVRRTEQQVGLNRQDRIRNMDGAFGWRGHAPTGAVVLVDDVVTTGASLSSAARTLRAAGAPSVWACTLAFEPAPDAARGAYLKLPAPQGTMV